MLVAPSILSADFGKLAEDVKAICEGGCDLVHRTGRCRSCG